jgi:aryl-alcohol dehydrogenase-like predicted oxidoreductase
LRTRSELLVRDADQSDHHRLLNPPQDRSHDEGKVRHIGLSEVTVEELRAAQPGLAA